MNKNIGQYLKELREKKHLSQNQLAKKLHISRSVIAKYETGEREPSFNNLIILSKYFKIPITDLIPIYENSIKSNNTKDVLNYLLKQNKSFRVAVLTLIVVLFMITLSAVIYINVLNYVSTKVYKVAALKSNPVVKDGLLVKTKDKVYLYLSNNLDNNKVEKLKFYYLDDNEKVYVFETSEINNIKLSVDLNDDDYFDSRNYKDFFNNSYIEICYKDTKTESIKLTYEFDYTNNNLESDIERITSGKTTSTENDISAMETFLGNDGKSELYDIAIPFIEKHNLESFNVKLDGINYEILVVNKSLSVLYKHKNKKYDLSYLYVKDKEMLKLDEITNSTIMLYSINLTDKKCDGNSCSEVGKGIEKVKDILEKIEK